MEIVDHLVSKLKTLEVKQLALMPVSDIEFAVLIKATKKALSKCGQSKSTRERRVKKVRKGISHSALYMVGDAFSVSLYQVNDTLTEISVLRNA